MSKMKDKKVKQVLSGGWYQWEEGGHKGRKRKAEYGGNTMYSCMKMEK
jgi:chitinase